MKKTLQMILLIGAGVAAGACLHECQSRSGLPAAERRESTVADTVKYYDTIPYPVPVPVRERETGRMLAKLRREASIPERDEMIPAKPGTETATRYDREPESRDSVAVEIPITQREYEGEDYRAWVSGYEPRLDSILVFARRDVVTIREARDKPKRWGIGVFAGYGITPKGMQPCVGISINYDLVRF